MFCAMASCVGVCRSVALVICARHWRAAAQQRPRIGESRGVCDTLYDNPLSKDLFLSWEMDHFGLTGYGARFARKRCSR